jgi:hypothetical protein
VEKIEQEIKDKNKPMTEEFKLPKITSKHPTTLSVISSEEDS